MQQRRLRLGDIVDDYCPRERRVTNHAVVAMIEDQVKQTRCATCDSDHEYKQARVPAQRRKKAGAPAPDGQVVEDMPRGRVVAQDLSDIDDDIPVGAEGTLIDPMDETPVAAAPREDALEGARHAAGGDAPEDAGDDAREDAREDEGPVHRTLIRATLPKVEGQLPERKPTDFTVRQPGQRPSRFEQNGNNGHRQGRDQRGPFSNAGGGQSRFGGQRQGGGGGQRQSGGRPGGTDPNRQGRPPGGQGPGQGSGQGQPRRRRGR